MVCHSQKIIFLARRHAKPIPYSRGGVNIFCKEYVKKRSYMFNSEGSEKTSQKMFDYMQMFDYLSANRSCWPFLHSCLLQPGSVFSSSFTRFTP